MTTTTRARAALTVLATILAASAPAVSGAGVAASAPPPASSDDTGDPGEPAFSLAISPTRLVVDRADVDTPQEVQIINGGTASMSVTVGKRDFTTDRDGTVVFQDAAPYSASDWVTITPETVEVPAGETRSVVVDIDVPPSPEPGDHQLAMVFLVPAGETGDNVRINRGIGMPAFVTVPGPVDDSAAVTALDAGGFSMGGRVDVTATVEDTGTVHRDFRDATPLLVDAAGTAEPFPDFTVMRGSTRDIGTTWDPPLLCICHPSVTITNDDGTTSAMSVRVIVFPVLPVAIGVAVLLLLALGYVVLRRRYRRDVTRAAAALTGPVGAGPREGG